ncbi:MAG: hypothetical protein LBV09_06345 [Deferribacteraceae bacterium]|nr:hypothetical protein [Deferribacteraceae bacterium]
MSLNTLVFFNLVAILILLIIVINLMLRLRRLEAKSVDVTPKDVAAYVDQMREILIESERAAEILDATIKEREAALEDLSDLVEDKLRRLSDITAYTKPAEKKPKPESSMQNKVYRLLLQGFTEDDIARQLGISEQEVNLLINMVKE